MEGMAQFKLELGPVVHTQSLYCTV